MSPVWSSGSTIASLWWKAWLTYPAYRNLSQTNLGLKCIRGRVERGLWRTMSLVTQELQTQMPVWARLATYWAGFNTQEVVRPVGNKKVKKIKYITHELYFFMGYDSSLSSIKKIVSRVSLVAQWLRICPPMQGTRVRALVWEDTTCSGATGPVSHNYWACASGACALQQERPR